MITLELPYPPSVNHYWRHVGRKVLVSREGRAYRNAVAAILAAGRMRPFLGRLELLIDVYPPDHRRRDLDNAMKSLLDSMMHGGIYDDDSQIDKLTIVRRRVVPGGKAIVSLKEYADGDVRFD
jgi:crossover junction endodeoxyribonuclease RusA